MYKGSKKFVFLLAQFLALFTSEKQASNLNSEREPGRAMDIRRKLHNIKY